MTLTIRNFRPGDEDAASYVCLKTGDSGQDAEPLFQEDPDALTRIYVLPYLKFSPPELALMLEDEQGICGYVLGTFDSRTHFGRYDKEWRPQLCEQFPAPTGDPAGWTPAQEIHHLYHHPNYFTPDPYEQYPSHLHIDFLERARGQGMGRRMINELTGRLKEMGSPGVHLGLSNLNDDAYAFYQAVGFHELTRDGDAIYMGMILQEG